MLTAVEATVRSSEAGPKRKYPNFVSVATGLYSPVSHAQQRCARKISSNQHFYFQDSFS